MRASTAVVGRQSELRRQRDALVVLSRLATTTRPGDDAEHRFTEVAAATLGVARASVWLREQDGRAIRCIDLYDAARGEHSSGTVLLFEAAPRYFEALSEMDVIAAHDARTDSRTSELREGYLDRLGVSSMLDAPIRVGGRIVGVLCNEHTGPARQFGPDEESFAVAVANLIALHLAEVQRRAAEADARLRLAALEAVAQPVVITDIDGLIVWTNPAFTEVTGYTRQEAVGEKPGSLLRSGEHDADFYAHLWRTVLSGHVWRGLIRNRRKNGEVYTEQMAITPLSAEGAAVTHFVAVKVDMTERQHLEQQLLQSQKLETVGQLAAGVAHDFNNLLGVINGAADLLLSQLADEDSMTLDLCQIRDAGNQAALLTHQLLAFSRQQIMALETLEVETIARDLLPLLSRLIGRHLTTTLTGGADPGFVRADRGQLVQVIMNLVVNARDATPDGGVITIRTGNCGPDGRLADARAGMEEAPFVLLSVSDTGAGMTDELQARVFEPFFTTKGLKGTGLGLATVYGIVKQSGGAIEVESKVGAGTTMRILFPRVAPKGKAVPKPGRREIATNSGRIMVVEDEPSLRRLTVRILRIAGYEVDEAADGDDALSRLGDGRAPVDLLITDLVMAGMGGRRLAEQSRRNWPGMKILFTSGYSSDEVLRADLGENDHHFLPKPYSVWDLTGRVSELLAQA